MGWILVCLVFVPLLVPGDATCSARADAPSAVPSAAPAAPAVEPGTPSSDRLERFVASDDAKQVHTFTGRVLVAAEDGGLLVQGQDGKLWTVEKPQLKERTALGEPFVLWETAELSKRLKEEFGPGFDVVTTKHYVICTNTSREYAKWCGMLFERLFDAFANYWKSRGLKLTEPEGPLVALVFATEAQFGKYATSDAGPDTATAKGYFSIRTNRIVLYDLTGRNGVVGNLPAAEINRRMAAAPFNLATVVHEATHQIAFNSGLHTRYADNPVWLSEGMAMFFEAPDLTSKSGWSTIGAVHPLRLRQFRDYLGKRRKSDSLRTLIQNDERLTGAETSGDAYAEAWALSFFLIKTRKEAYVKYLATISKKPRLQWGTSEQRLADFAEHFGDSFEKLDREFLTYIARLPRS